MGRTPNLQGISVCVDYLFKMDSERCTVGSVRAAGWSYALRDVKNNACEAVFVEIDLLAVGNLTYCAGLRWSKSR